FAVEDPKRINAIGRVVSVVGETLVEKSFDLDVLPEAVVAIEPACPLFLVVLQRLNRWIDFFRFGLLPVAGCGFGGCFVGRPEVGGLRGRFSAAKSNPRDDHGARENSKCGYPHRESRAVFRRKTLILGSPRTNNVRPSTHCEARLRIRSSGTP